MVELSAGEFCGYDVARDSDANHGANDKHGNDCCCHKNMEQGTCPVRYEDFGGTE